MRLFIIQNHYKEFKYKLIYILISFIITSWICYLYSFEILELLIHSLQNNEYKEKTFMMFFSNIYDTFYNFFLINILVTLYILIPYNIINLWFFFKTIISKKNILFILYIYIYLCFIYIFFNIIFYILVFPFIIINILENFYFNNNNNYDIYFMIQINILNYLTLFWIIIYLYNILLLIPLFQILLIRKLYWIKYKKLLFFFYF